LVSYLGRESRLEPDRTSTLIAVEHFDYLLTQYLADVGVAGIFLASVSRSIFSIMAILFVWGYTLG
jgi:hypothetical protein